MSSSDPRANIYVNISTKICFIWGDFYSSFSYRAWPKKSSELTQPGTNAEKSTWGVQRFGVVMLFFSRHTHQKWFSYFNHQVLKHPSCCSRYPTLDLGTIVSCVRRTNELFPMHPPPYVHNHMDTHPVSLGVVAFSSPKSPDLFSFTSGGCSAHELNSSPLSQSF